MLVSEVVEFLDKVSVEVRDCQVPNVHLKHEFARILAKTVENEAFRLELSKNAKVWRLIQLIIIEDCVESEETMRLQRGAVILGRNLLSMDRDIARDLALNNDVLLYLNKISRLETVPAPFKRDVVVSAYQFLCNLSVEVEGKDVESFDFLYEIEIANFDPHDEVNYLIFTYVSNLFKNSEILGFVLKNRVPVVDYVLDFFEKISFTDNTELSSFELLIIKIGFQITIHESFLNFMYNKCGETDMIRYLRMSEHIVTSKESYEIFELTVILSWNWELFEKTLAEIEDFFGGAKVQEVGTEQTINISFVYKKTFICLDNLTSLLKFDHTVKFLNFYKAIGKLIELLRIIQDNVKPMKLKDSELKNFKSQEKHFPNIKSMIIEILTSLVYENRENQNLVRELHGIELVLNCCNLDSNEPFIKERSIICLRYLLLGNELNQKFVSELKAQEPIQDENLREAGFEVELESNGTVKLKNIK